jgi:hypothetical protein
VDVDSDLYMLLAEGPICCAGAIGILIVIMGFILAITGAGRAEEFETEQEYPTGTGIEGQDQTWHD